MFYMSKLPNAPLVEVIFEIRWNSSDKANLDKFQLLIGAMYSALKGKFPSFINLKPDSNMPDAAFIGMPTHRFTSNNVYPMYQLGPGVLSVNMINSNYVWEYFLNTINDVVNVFEHLSELQGQQVTLALKYIDFFKCKFSEIDLSQYISDNFHLCVSAPYLSNKKSKTFSYATTMDVDMGLLTLTMNTGYNNIEGQQVEGIITESNISNSFSFEGLNSYIKDQLPSAHELLGTFFKELTEGTLYNSFK